MWPKWEFCPVHRIQHGIWWSLHAPNHPCAAMGRNGCWGKWRKWSFNEEATDQHTFFTVLISLCIHHSLHWFLCSNSESERGSIAWDICCTANRRFCTEEAVSFFREPEYIMKNNLLKSVINSLESLASSAPRQPNPTYLKNSFSNSWNCSIIFCLRSEDSMENHSLTCRLLGVNTLSLSPAMDNSSLSSTYGLPATETAMTLIPAARTASASLPQME